MQDAAVSPLALQISYVVHDLWGFANCAKFIFKFSFQVSVVWATVLSAAEAQDDELVGETFDFRPPPCP